MSSQRLNPTLFDKLVSHLELHGLRSRDDSDELTSEETGRRDLLRYDIANVERFTETSLRANVRRELAWLMNTTNLESGHDLSGAPNVRTSVLNYGVADLTGKTNSRTAVHARAARIKHAIQAFEPRLETSGLTVDVRFSGERENAVTFVITGDISAAVQSLKVRYIADVEVDTGIAEVRE